MLSPSKVQVTSDELSSFIKSLTFVIGDAIDFSLPLKAFLFLSKALHLLDKSLYFGISADLSPSKESNSIDSSSASGKRPMALS